MNPGVAMATKNGHAKPRSRGDEPAIKGSLPEMGLKTPLTRG